MSKPGLFQDTDRIRLLENAITATEIGLDFRGFEAALSRVGYRSDQQGQDGNNFWLIALTSGSSKIF